MLQYIRWCQNKWTVAIGALAMIAIFGGLLSSQVHSKSKNLFDLTFALGHTTSQMAANTEALRNNVNHVKAKLSQLNTQEAILNQQVKTSEQLDSTLRAQVGLTITGVARMKQILTNEQISSEKASLVDGQTAQLSQIVGQNEQYLGSTVQSLQGSVANSITLNHQMDGLLAELRVAADEFKVFGQLHGILSGATNLIGLDRKKEGGR